MSKNTRAGTTGYYVATAVCLGVSLDTSWGVFTNVLHVHPALLRDGLFGAGEVVLAAAALGMRGAASNKGPIGPHRLFAWGLVSLLCYGAFLSAGPLGGSIRAAFMVAGMVCLHMALGIEVRAKGEAKASTWARMRAEFRERFLSRLGLGDDQRDAVTRTQQRAATRVARLAVAQHALLRTARLNRALRVAGVAHSPAMNTRMLAELGTLRNAASLITLQLPSPWSASAPSALASAASGAGERDEQDALVSDDTYANGVLDGAVLAANTEPPWDAVYSKNDAIDRADELLPGRTARALVTALGQVDITVAESSVRRRRAERERTGERDEHGERSRQEVSE